jgi:hypothetical protein
MDIIAHLATEKKTRYMIGRMQIHIQKLVQEFFWGNDSPKPL